MGNKSSGSDEYNFSFLKTCWNTMKVDIMNFVEEFFQNMIFAKAITTTFLTLVPKSNNPHDLNDYRNIFLVGSLYKILAKILTTMLKKVNVNLISQW